MTDTISSFFDKYKALDWTHTVILLDGGSVLYTPACVDKEGSTCYPREYLENAELDLSLRNRRGNTNAVSNAKRAIDSMAVTFLDLVGCRTIKSGRREFLKERGFSNRSRPGESSDLKVMEALGVVPTTLAYEVRSLRDLVEHEYAIPSNEETQRAVEIASLLIGQVENVATNYPCSITLADEKYLFHYEGDSRMSYPCIHIDFKEPGVITLSSRYLDPDVTIEASSPFYLHLIRLMCKIGIGGSAISPLKDLLKAANVSIEEKEIHIMVVPG